MPIMSTQGVIKKEDLKLTLAKKRQISEIQTDISSELPSYNIVGYSISMMTAAKAVKNGYTLISNPSTDKSPIYTINDPRLGVVSDDYLCGTCHQDLTCCVGHYGYIKLSLIHI